jgi:hypothetical protein
VIKSGHKVITQGPARGVRVMSREPIRTISGASTPQPVSSASSKASESAFKCRRVPSRSRAVSVTACANAAARGTASVPPRRPLSCPPPGTSGFRRRSGAEISAAIPAGPSSFAEPMTRCVAPVSENRNARDATACTASRISAPKSDSGHNVRSAARSCSVPSSPDEIARSPTAFGRERRPSRCHAPLALTGISSTDPPAA